MCHPPARPRRLPLCHRTTPLLLWDQKNMGMDARMVTYIGGLHSPPVSQPTAIHQDIQLGGRGGGTCRRSLRGGWWGGIGWWVGVVSGRARGTRDPHGTGDPPDRQLFGEFQQKKSKKKKEASLLCPQVLAGWDHLGWVGWVGRGLQRLVPLISSVLR